jgi:general secretion pathway protein B
MSFILDALKKSESDRQRQSGPAIFEVKVTPPRTGLPPWALALAALLLVTLVINAWILLRHTGAHATAAATPGADSAPAATVSAPAPAPALTATITASAAAAPAPPPPSIRPAPAAAPPALQPPRAALSPALVPPAAGTGEPGVNPDDYAPAGAPVTPVFGSHVRRGTVDGVPLYQDAAATPGTNIPQLRLDLHVFAVRPQDRFVMINMKKLHEGDSLPEGVHVDSITPEGALLSYNGSRFLLPRD